MACSDKKDDKPRGAAIGAPQVEPPVTRNLPAGFSSQNLALLEAQSTKDTALAALQSLIAPSDGFIGIVQRLESIDNRVAELNLRAIEVPKACLADSVQPTAYDIGGELPGDSDLTVLLQCQENLDDNVNFQLAFGLTEDEFHLVERNADNGLFVIATAALDGSSTNVWQIGTSSGSGSTNHATFTHITASDSAGFEATVGGTDTSGQGGAYPCGIHIKTNSSLVYMSASVAASGCSDVETYCVSADDFSDQPLSECSDANLNDFSLTSITPELSAPVLNDAASIIAKAITGYIDFTLDEEVSEED